MNVMVTVAKETREASNVVEVSRYSNLGKL